MELEIKKGTDREYEDAIACPAIDPDDFSTIEAHLDHLDKVLEEKNAEKAEVLCLRSIIPLDDPSDNFSLIGDVFRSIVYFASMHEYPEKICIMCDSEETEELYEEVYDFWFPEE